MRFFHLKILKNKSTPFSLQETFHQHRGFVADNLLSTLKEFKEFLDQHPKEIILVGVNNINGFDDESLVQLVTATVKFWEDKTITAEDLYQTPLDTLVQQNRRFGLFMEKSNSPQVISTETHLHEQWDPSGHSGNTALFSEFLKEDMKNHATQEKHFYVLQANPNNNQDAMFESVLNRDNQSLESWQSHFMKTIRDLVRNTISENPKIRINSINADFQEISKVTELALSLNGF